MPTRRKKQHKPRPKGRTRRLGPTLPDAQPSPSPVATGVAQGSPLAVGATLVPVAGASKPLGQGHTAKNLRDRGLAPWYLPPNSKIRSIALSIMAMRAAGKSEEEIAVELRISPKSIAPYVYRAAKNGWLTADTPADRIKYELLHKVVKRLGEGLDDTTRHSTSGMRVRTAVALKMAEDTIFKEFDQAGSTMPPSAIVAVQVIMPSGVQQTIREDTMGGTPVYALDADVA